MDWDWIVLDWIGGMDWDWIVQLLSEKFWHTSFDTNLCQRISVAFFFLLPSSSSFCLLLPSAFCLCPKQKCIPGGFAYHPGARNAIPKWDGIPHRIQVEPRWDPMEIKWDPIGSNWDWIIQSQWIGLGLVIFLFFNYLQLVPSKNSIPMDWIGIGLDWIEGMDWDWTVQSQWIGLGLVVLKFFNYLHLVPPNNSIPMDWDWLVQSQWIGLVLVIWKFFNCLQLVPSSNSIPMDGIGIGLDWGGGLGLNNSMDWVGIGNIEVLQLSPVGYFQ